MGGAAGDEDAGLFADRWGMFASVSSGKGDSDDDEFEFDFDSYDVTIGIDTTKPKAEKTWVYGGALSVGKVDTDTKLGDSKTSSDSVGVTVYSSIFDTDGKFYDASLSYSESDIDIDRAVDFNASNKNFFQGSSGDTDADELGLSLGAGKEFNFGANSVVTNIKLHYINGTIGGLTENIQNGGSGFGLALETDDFDFTLYSF